MPPVHLLRLSGRRKSNPKNILRSDGAASTLLALSLPAEKTFAKDSRGSVFRAINAGIPMLHIRAIVRSSMLLPAIALIAPSLAFAQAAPVGSTTPVLNTYSRGSSVAFDPVNKVYLVISAYNTPVNAIFINESGAAASAPFVVGPTCAGAHFPRAAYSPDADNGGGGFLVTWHCDTAGSTFPFVHGAMVSFAHGAYGTDTTLDTAGAWWENGPNVAYSTTSKEFLVVWRSPTYDIKGIRVNNSGAALGAGTFAVTSTAIQEDNPSVAYNPTTNDFFVVYSATISDSPQIGAIFGQRIQAGTGAFNGSPTQIVQTGYTYITDVAYNSATNKYLAAWYSLPAGQSLGQVVNSDGTLSGGTITLSAYWHAYDAIGLAYNPISGTFFLVSHSSGYEDGGVEIQGTGQPVDNGGLITNAGGPVGNFYPRLAASTDQTDWLVSTAHNFASTAMQKIHTATTSGPPPPPPPPPCTASAASPTLINASSLASTVTVSVTASCSTWTTSSGASWLGVTPGTGSATVSIGQNSTSVAREGTVSVGGVTIMVAQPPIFHYPAAVADYNGDGLSDIVFQQQSTGQIAVWNMSGSTVTSTTMLSSYVSDLNWKIEGTGDLNGDGYMDVIWRNTSNGQVAAWLESPTGPLAEALLSIGSVTDQSWQIRGVADTNGDGKADLIWQNDATGDVAVWFMNGFTVTGTYFLSVPRVTDLNWKIVGAGDINGDGHADIIWQNQSTGALGAWELNGNLVVGQSNLTLNGTVISSFPSNWKIRGVGDVNGDGHADLIWEDSNTGNMGIWLLNGYSIILQSNIVMQDGSLANDTGYKAVGPG